jgi:hypothetical protein
VEVLRRSGTGPDNTSLLSSPLEDRADVVSAARRLVCRFFVDKIAAAAPSAVRGGRHLLQDSASADASTRSVLVEPVVAAGRRDMAAPFSGQQLLKLPLCREVMAALVAPEQEAVQDPARGQGWGVVQTPLVGSRAAGAGAAPAARLIDVLGKVHERDGGRLPPCAGSLRADALVAVDKQRWGAADVVAGRDLH